LSIKNQARTPPDQLLQGRRQINHQSQILSQAGSNLKPSQSSTITRLPTAIQTGTRSTMIKWRKTHSKLLNLEGISRTTPSKYQHSEEDNPRHRRSPNQLPSLLKILSSLISLRISLCMSRAKILQGVKAKDYIRTFNSSEISSKISREAGPHPIVKA
jgi:hypothetical protein